MDKIIKSEQKIELEKIKLIIWDLDETFWCGTLSEQNVVPVDANIKLIKKLTERGVINSICSKNDFDTVKKEFSKKKYKGVWDYFVFSSIDWTPKGQRIKDLIQNMQLRPINVLFIDDNMGNLEEAKFYNPELNVATPDIISDIIKISDTVGKDDSKLSRLNQYKILETKYQAKQNASSNLDFLYASDIQITINKDCLPEKQRIHELINRSNQMNYTKIRLDEEQLSDVLQKPNIENAYISAKDKFGDYGIIGFYSLDTTKNKLIHFVFSCRILGMGIDQYLYQKLNFPDIDIVGEISSHIEPKHIVDYVHETDDKQAIKEDTKDLKYNVLLKGPCDLESVLPYLKNIYIDKEFIHTNKDEPDTIAQQCLTHVVAAHKYSKQDCADIINNTPILSRYDFDTKIYDGSYDYVFLSTLLEGQIAVYEHKKQHYKICYGWPDFDFTDSKNWDTLTSDSFSNGYGVRFTKTMLKQLAKDYKYCGLPTPKQVLDNVLYIRNNLPEKTKLVLLLGSEIDCEHPAIPGYDNVASRYRKINKILMEQLSEYKNIEFVNITECISSQSDFTDCTNHYVRTVYYKIAEKINNIISDNNIETSTDDYKQDLKNLRKRLRLNKIKRFFLFYRRAHYNHNIDEIMNKINEITSLIKYIQTKGIKQ